MTATAASKLFGGITCLIGTGILYADYLVFRAVGALSNHIASLIGVTGEAATGVMVIGWFLTLGLMAAIFLLGALTIGYGMSKITGKRT